MVRNLWTKNQVGYLRYNQPRIKSALERRLLNCFVMCAKKSSAIVFYAFHKRFCLRICPYKPIKRVQMPFKLEIRRLFLRCAYIWSLIRTKRPVSDVFSKGLKQSTSAKYCYGSMLLIRRHGKPLYLSSFQAIFDLPLAKGRDEAFFLDVPLFYVAVLTNCFWNERKFQIFQQRLKSSSRYFRVGLPRVGCGRLLEGFLAWNAFRAKRLFRQTSRTYCRSSEKSWKDCEFFWALDNRIALYLLDRQYTDSRSSTVLELSDHSSGSAFVSTLNCLMKHKRYRTPPVPWQEPLYSKNQILVDR